VKYKICIACKHVGTKVCDKCEYADKFEMGIEK